MDKDYNDTINSFNPYMNMQTGFDMNDIYKDPVLNPALQYEQAYSYYRYLCMQMDYKIKCKEYEKLCQNSRNKVILVLINMDSSILKKISQKELSII